MLMLPNLRCLKLPYMRAWTHKLSSTHAQVLPRRTVHIPGNCKTSRYKLKQPFCRWRAFSVITDGSTANEDVTWIMPADTNTVRMDKVHKKGILDYQMSLTITTAKPLQDHHFPKLLTVLTKKILPLRTRLRMKDGCLWICEMKDPVIDFQICEGSDLSTEIEKLAKIGFYNSHNEPLWRIRVFRGGVNDTRYALGLETFPHETTFIISFHHGVFDGSSGFVTAMTLMELIEDLLEGSPLDETEVGRLAGDEQTQPLVKEMRTKMEQDPQRLRSLINQRLEASFNSLITEAFGMPKVNGEPQTLVIESDIESLSLVKFAAECRNAGVTFNAGMTAAINIALVELVQKAGLVRDKYEVTSRHAVNLRRYWKREPTFAYGCHLGGMLQTVDVPPFSHEGFWHYARGIGAEQREMLRNRSALEEVVVKDIILEESMKNETHSSANFNIVCDYFLSNLYSGAESTFPEENIHLSQLFYNIRHHNWDYAICNAITEFGGNLRYHLSYCDNYMTDETALAFVQAIKDVVIRTTED